LWPRNKDRYFFYVMVEGVEVTVHTLLSVINIGETISMPAVLALVSNDGTVTYYFVAENQATAQRLS
jgi:tRNA-intron endonuclease